MKCDELKLLLVSHADGSEAEAVREHLAACEDCRELTEQLKADAELLRRDPRPDVPEYLATRVMAEVRARQRRARPWSALSRTIMRLAALVLVIVGIWMGTVLGRGMMGSRQELADRLAALETESKSGEDR